jgi:hypothetical protein
LRSIKSRRPFFAADGFVDGVRSIDIPLETRVSQRNRLLWTARWVNRMQGKDQGKDQGSGTQIPDPRTWLAGSAAVHTTFSNAYEEPASPQRRSAQGQHIRFYRAAAV